MEWAKRDGKILHRASAIGPTPQIAIARARIVMEYGDYVPDIAPWATTAA